jgi:hypothetical protein
MSILPSVSISADEIDISCSTSRSGSRLHHGGDSIDLDRPSSPRSFPMRRLPHPTLTDHSPTPIPHHKYPSKRRRLSRETPEQRPSLSVRSGSSPGPLPRDTSAPLFFSSKPFDSHSRPRLPPRFSSGEAGQRMFSEESNIKTVTLARGNYAELGGPSPGFLSSRSRTTSERSNPTWNASPEDVSSPNGLKYTLRMTCSRVS